MRGSIPYVLAACLGASILAVSSPASAQGHASARFGKWHTFCDKNLLCAAYTYSGTEGNPHSSHVFTLERAGNGNAWTMSLTLDQVEPRLSFGLAASVIRYGHDNGPIPPFGRQTLALYGSSPIPGTVDSYVLYLSGASAETIMKRLRPGDVLDFEFGGCSDEFLYANFSLQGISAALTWIDEKQGLPESNKITRSHHHPGPAIFLNCD